MPVGQVGLVERLAVDEDVAVLRADRLPGQSDHALDEVLDGRVDRLAVGPLGVLNTTMSPRCTLWNLYESLLTMTRSFFFSVGTIESDGM